MRKLLLLLSFVAVLGMAAACAEPPPEPSPYRIVASDQELMNGIIVPNAEVIWESVGTIVDINGINDFQPETDEEWEEVAGLAKRDPDPTFSFEHPACLHASYFGTPIRRNRSVKRGSLRRRSKIGSTFM